MELKVNKRGQILIIVFIFILLIVIGIYVVFFVNRPISETANAYSNISISAVNEDDVNIRTGYEIYVDGVMYSNGTTNKYGATLTQVSQNKTIKVLNKNLNNQNYYSEIITKFIDTKTNITAIKFNLREPKELEIIQTGSLANDPEIRLQVMSNSFQNVHACIDTSRHFWAVNIISRPEKVDIPLRYKDYDYCYDLDKSLNKGNKLIVLIEPKIWGVLDIDDYIKVTFIDGNMITDGINDYMTLGEKEDIGAKDVTYVVNMTY